MKTILFLNIIFCVLLFSCNNAEEENTNDIKNEEIINNANQNSTQLSIETAQKKDKFIVGESVIVSVNQKDTISYDSIQIYFDKKYLKTVTELPANFDVGSEKTGRADFEARIYKNAASNIQKNTLRFLSDIQPKNYTYEVVKVYPHDKNAFTQGLVFENGFFYEATGLKGESSIRKVQVGTGDIIQSYSVDPQIFGEGVTIFGDKIIQLSWQHYTGFVYDKKSFQLLAKFSYSTEGWGLTNDGKYLIMSDGTNKIYFLDSESYSEMYRIEVYDNKGMVDQLNELEFIDGEIYANVYQTNKIARIDPATGKVLAYIDLTGILPDKDRIRGETDVLNGIAYDFENKKLFVTGKKWPKLFEIKLIEKK
jgi:glutamine cyclotransferase